MRRSAGLLLCLLAVGVGPSAVGASDRTASTTRLSGTATGGVVQNRHFESTDQSRPAVYDDKQVYKARFSFTFRITRGRISGSGLGRYTNAAWHSDGTFGSSPFSCDAAMKTPPFVIQVTGRLSGRAIALRLGLKATETNERDIFCLPNFKLEAGTTTRLADSLAAVGADEPTFAKRDPKLQIFSKHEDFIKDSIPTTPPTRAHVVRDSQWKITIRRLRAGK